MEPHRGEHLVCKKRLRNPVPACRNARIPDQHDKSLANRLPGHAAAQRAQNRYWGIISNHVMEEIRTAKRPERAGVAMEVMGAIIVRVLKQTLGGKTPSHRK